MRPRSVYTWVVLLLGIVFVFCCIGWLAHHRTTPPGWQVHTEHTATTPHLPDPGNPADGLLEGEVIDLNAASRSDLLRLPDIGTVRADAILSYRAEHGSFQSVDDLLNVFGIGPTTLEQLRPYICAK